MSTTEAILKTVSALSPEKQEAVLHFAQELRAKTEPRPQVPAVSALRTVAALKVDGPPDWSERFHEYLYGENARDGK